MKSILNVFFKTVRFLTSVQSCTFNIHNSASFEGDRSQTSQWCDFAFLSQVKGQQFCIMSVTYLVLLPKMYSSPLYGHRRKGLWYSFILSVKKNHSQQQLDNKDIDIMQTEYHIIKCKKHMEFPQIYQSNVDNWGENLPGESFQNCGF